MSEEKKSSLPISEERVRILLREFVVKVHMPVEKIDAFIDKEMALMKEYFNVCGRMEIHSREYGFSQPELSRFLFSPPNSRAH